MKRLIVSILLISTFSCGCTNINQQPISTMGQCNKNEKPVSENITLIDKAEQDCMKDKCSTTDMNKCSLKARTAWFKEIDKYMQLLQTITTHEDYNKILKSQNEWKKYQETEFETISLITQKDGTMFQNSASGVKTNVIKERALELKRLYDFLNY